MIEGAPEEFKLDELIAPLSTASTVSRVADAVQRLRSDKTRMSNSASQSAAPVVKSIMPALRFAIVKHHDKVATSADPVIPYDLYLYDRVTLDHLYLILPKVKVGWCLTQGIRDIVLEQGGSLTAADTSVPGGQRGPYHGLVVYDLLCMRLPLSTKAPDRQLEEELHHRVAETVACYLWLLEGWSGYASTYLRHNHTIHLPCLMALVSPAHHRSLLPLTFSTTVAVWFDTSKLSHRPGRLGIEVEAGRCPSPLDHRRNSISARAKRIPSTKP
jgi:hypothetical protein